MREYTAAYEKLQDPIVLFNRADRYRQLGEERQGRGLPRLPAGFPAAPNRKEIEARIATPEAAAPRAPKPPASAPPPIARTPVAPPPPTRTPSPTPPPAVPPPARVEAVGPMPFLPPPPGAGEPRTLVEAPRSTPGEQPAEASHGSHWWIWTTLAVVAVGGGVAAYWFLRPKDEPVPPSTLGSYRF